MAAYSVAAGVLPPGDFQYPLAAIAARLIVLKVDEVGLLVFVEFLPFVEPVRRDEAPAFLERGAEGRLRGNGIRPGVDEPLADLRVLCPRRDQAPTERDQTPLAVLILHGGRSADGGARVEARPTRGRA